MLVTDLDGEYKTIKESEYDPSCMIDKMNVVFFNVRLHYFQMMTIIVMGLGLADTWFDFRKLQKQPTK